jgi:probable HAF family extracellular repeat protein
VPKLGGTKNFALGLNKLGQVVGRSDTAAGVPHAFLDEFLNGKDEIFDLAVTLAGGGKSGAVAISGSGQIVAFYNAPDGKSHIVEWTPLPNPDRGLEFLMEDLGPGVAADIDDVIGTKDGAPRSSLWKRLPDGTLIDIDVGSLGGKYTDAQKINDFRQIVGESQTAAGDFHAFLWQNGTMIDLSVQNGGLGYPFYINNLTEVVCTWRPTPGNYTLTHTVLLRPGKPMLDLTPGSNTFPNGINDLGQILVTSGKGAAATTVLLGPDGSGGYKVLDTLPITGVRGINDAGQLIYNSPENLAFLVTPVGGKTLTGPETDNAIGLIGNLQAELVALPVPPQEEARNALTSIGWSLVGAKEYLQRGCTLCAAGNLHGVLRIMKAHLPPEAGGTPERINRLNGLITLLGGTPDV